MKLNIKISNENKTVEVECSDENERVRSIKSKAYNNKRSDLDLIIFGLFYLDNTSLIEMEDHEPIGKYISLIKQSINDNTNNEIHTIDLILSSSGLRTCRFRTLTGNFIYTKVKYGTRTLEFKQEMKRQNDEQLNYCNDIKLLCLGREIQPNEDVTELFNDWVAESNPFTCILR